MMTNEEAIKMIKDDVRLHHDHLSGKYRKALSMAIEALSNSQKQSDSEIRASADAVSEVDVIYRADAIDAVKKNTFRLTFAEEQNCEGHVAWSAEAVYSDVMEGALMELPSAQPDKDMIHLQKEQAYMQGWEDGQNALREEMWEDGRDRLD